MSPPPFVVLLFAGLRERARSSELVVPPGGIETVGDLLAQVAILCPAVASALPNCRVAVDQEFVTSDHPLRGSEEIAVIPPVSGGHDGARILLSDAPLSLDGVVRVVSHRGAGGIATFTGNVRLHSRGQTVDHLVYEAYAPMAIKVMAQIADRIEQDVSGSRVAIHHRVGQLTVGDTAVVIAASAPHRAEAFAACRAAIEALKEDVPIWKKEVSTEGQSWIERGP